MLIIITGLSVFRNHNDGNRDFSSLIEPTPSGIQNRGLVSTPTLPARPELLPQQSRTVTSTPQSRSDGFQDKTQETGHTSKLGLAGRRGQSSARELGSLKVAVRDGLISVTPNGDMVGREQLDPVTQHLVLVAVNRSAVHKPEIVKDIDPAVEYRGVDEGKERPEAFGFVSPSGLVIMEDRPVFRWTKHPDAVGYIVRIFDENNTNC